MAEKKEAASLVRTVAVPSEGDDYEILVLAKESGYELRVKKNGELFHLGGSVEYDTAYDYERQFGENACNMLVELIRKSILDKTREPKQSGPAPARHLSSSPHRRL